MFSSLDQKSVPLRGVFWVGMIMALFNPPVVGLVFSLLMLFKFKERRGAAFIAVWSIVWTVIFSMIISVLVSQGDVPANSPLL